MRLTEKIFVNNEFACYGCASAKQPINYNRNTISKLNNLGDIVNKLGQLEDILQCHKIEKLEELDGLLWYVKRIKDIEDELGIDLVTLFKAIKDGIYVKTKYGISKQYTINLRKWQQTNTYCLYYRPYTHIWFKDYGKTWALTKKELEDE